MRSACWHAASHGHWTDKPVWVRRAIARITNTGGDCGSAKCGAIDFHEWWCLRQQTCPFTMKVPDSVHEERMLACSESWTLDGQADMSKEGNSPDYEYRRRLREHQVRSNRLSWMVMSAPADMSVYYESPVQQRPLGTHRIFHKVIMYCFGTVIF